MHIMRLTKKLGFPTTNNVSFSQGYIFKECKYQNLDSLQMLKEFIIS